MGGEAEGRPSVDLSLIHILRNRAQRKELPSPGEHLLSPQDLCVIDLMPELVAAGAASLKIEGRMKSADYVFAVTSAYRAVLDRVLAARATGEAAAVPYTHLDVYKRQECGVLEDPWTEPPADIYTMTSDPMQAPDQPEYVELTFARGLPYMINGDQKSFLGIIYALNEIAGKHGYGRIDMIENRLVGVKSRECYEVPAGLALIQAHKALEDLVLEREVLHYKLGMEQAWATAVYNGQWFSPLKEAIDAFMASTQRCLSGTVRLKFYKGSCTVDVYKRQLRRRRRARLIEGTR